MGLFQKLHQKDLERRAKHPEWEERAKAAKAKRDEANVALKTQLALTGAARAERKATKQAEKEELVAARGKELGYVGLTFIGGYDDRRRYSGKLYFYEKRVEFHAFGQAAKDMIIINAPDIGGIEIGGQQQTTSRITVTRMVALGVFSLAAPKKSSIKDARLTLSLQDGRQVMFHTKALTEFEVHSKLANAISYYHQLQAKQAAQKNDSATVTDSATLLLKYDTLRKRGVITEEEFQAKKEQLLGL